MKDPFEAALEEQESPPESPIPQEEDAGVAADAVDVDDEEADAPSQPPASAPPSSSAAGGGGKGKEDEEEEEEENMDVEFGKLPSGGDPDKMVKMQEILSQFTGEQMSRYESFRRSGFQKANMRRLRLGPVNKRTVRATFIKLLTSITGSQKISIPMTIVVSGIGKMFVGELIETARIVMMERMDSGPIRPCHIREAYRRLKLEGKIPKRSVPRLFR